MDEDIVKRRRRELSKQQAIYVAARERGLPREESAVMAGYPAGQNVAKSIEKSPTVQDELQKARSELVAASGITREDVLAGLKKAADMAQVMSDPQAMVRAWSEIGKMLGHYAPEVKKHVHGLDAGTRAALEGATDEELLRLAHGRIIEGAVTAVIEEKEPTE